ncbi:MAG: DUF3710 domain-containing protein [Actinomycetia bacterium]|nr:DUF3710 domain-containing protein [Actinomycetes bacterium]
MGIFGRKKKTDSTESAAPQTAEALEEAPEPARGPRDLADAADAEGHLDLGSIRLKGIPGMQLRLEVDEDRQKVVGAQLVLGDSSMQIQTFAAPKSFGIWDEIRDEIAQGLATSGGTAEEVQGPLGTELHVRMPTRDASGRTVFSPARFIGVDGPRWFFRAVMSGRAAIDEAAAEKLYTLLDHMVVVRGDVPMAPREVLPLQLPKSQQAEDEGADSEAASDETKAGAKQAELNPFKRGPEITEIR